jgi:hypothetical protein
MGFMNKIILAVVIFTITTLGTQTMAAAPEPEPSPIVPRTESQEIRYGRLTPIQVGESNQKAEERKETPKPKKIEPYSGNRDWDYLLLKYDWNVEHARAIMMCESGGNPQRVNDNPKTKDYSVGLYQINLYGGNARTRPSEEWLKIPENNIEYAYKLYKSQGNRFGTTGGWFNCSKKHGIK